MNAIDEHYFLAWILKSVRVLYLGCINKNICTVKKKISYPNLNEYPYGKEKRGEVYW
jgi:hypothetical protein